MTTTPQAALLSEAERCAKNLSKWNANDDCWSPEHIRARSEAELRRLDALVAHLTADRDDTANELALRTKHNLALTNERDQLLAKLQATQEPVQEGELPPLPLPNDHNGYGRCPARYTTDQMYSYARAALSARKPLTPLTPAQMEKGRDQIFSINNPFCPCDSKTFSKVAEWVERHHGIGLEVKP